MGRLSRNDAEGALTAAGRAVNAQLREGTAGQGEGKRIYRESAPVTGDRLPIPLTGSKLAPSTTTTIPGYLRVPLGPRSDNGTTLCERADVCKPAVA